MENIGQKKKQIQVGFKCYFQRDKKGRIIPKGTTSEPIYQDWTPELQKGYDEMMSNFAKILADELFKAIGNGLDITKLGTKDADDFFKEQAEKKTAQVPAFFGRGALSFMVEQKGSSENYQGIIGLEQPTLTECVHQYFRDSEQIGTAVRLHIAPPDEKNGWRCGAIMIQKMPAAQKAASHLSEDEIEELWRTAVILLNSVTNEELVDTNLAVEKLVNRLYHLNDLQIFMPKLLEFGCRCSQEKVLEMLKSFPPQDIDDMIIDGKIIVDCQFCGRRYTLTSKDLSQENK